MTLSHRRLLAASASALFGFYPVSEGCYGLRSWLGPALAATTGSSGIIIVRDRMGTDRTVARMHLTSASG